MRNQTWYAKAGSWQRIGQAPIVPTDPATPKPLVGAATLNDSQASFTDLENDVGSLLIRRSYSGPDILPANFGATKAAIDAGVRESMWSFKPNPATFAAGGNDTWFNSFLDSIPSGHRMIIILWHEPEDNIANGEFSLAEWKAANNHLGALVHAKGRAELRTAICLMGSWTFNPASPYYTTEYWDAGFSSAIDYIGLDPYNSNSSFTKFSNDANLARAMNWAALHQKQVILPEFGCIDDPGGDPSKKVAWINDAYQYSVSANMYAICYFNMDGTIPDVPLSTPESLTAYANANADSKI